MSTGADPGNIPLVAVIKRRVESDLEQVQMSSLLTVFSPYQSLEDVLILHQACLFKFRYFSAQKSSWHSLPLFSQPSGRIDVLCHMQQSVCVRRW